MQGFTKTLAIELGPFGITANAVSFFVSDAAGFVSGQVLYVAGGPVS